MLLLLNGAGGIFSWNSLIMSNKLFYKSWRRVRLQYTRFSQENWKNRALFWKLFWNNKLYMKLSLVIIDWLVFQVTRSRSMSLSESDRKEKSESWFNKRWGRSLLGSGLFMGDKLLLSVISGTSCATASTFINNDKATDFSSFYCYAFTPVYTCDQNSETMELSKIQCIFHVLHVSKQRAAIICVSLVCVFHQIFWYQTYSCISVKSFKELCAGCDTHTIFPTVP